MARDLAAMGGFTITPDRFGELICCVDDMFVARDGGKGKIRLVSSSACSIGRCGSNRPGSSAAWRPGFNPGPSAGYPWWARLPRLAAGGATPRDLRTAPSRSPRRWSGRCEWPHLAKMFDEVLMQEIGG